MTTHDDEWVWLFSSNRRALYAQDVSNVAGLPEGARYQFRYREEWAGASVLAEWEQLAGRNALIVFSFQHPEHLHPPAFIPIRLAKVTSSKADGSFRIVEFEVGKSAALPSHSRPRETANSQWASDASTLVEPSKRS